MQNTAFRKWVDEVMELQESTPLFENPVFTVSELQDRFEVVSKLFSRLNTTPAPKPPPSPVPSPEDAKEEATAEPESGADTKESDSAGEADADSTATPHEELR